VETALDVINDIKRALVNRDPQLAPLPAFELYVIALAGGDFANSHVYYFGEIAEPIRALLNGREAHSYIAINRANADFNEPFSWPPHAEKKTNKPDQTPPAFNTTKLQNYFYPLPLGWAMSSKTRNIVAHESGRFWDCAAGTNFKQTKGYRNNADCVQLEIYNLLNYSAPSALADLQQADEIEKDLPQADHISADQVRSNQSFNQAVLGCYEAFWQKQHLDWWQKQQAKYEAANAAWRNVKSGNAPQPPHTFRQRYLAYYQVAHVEALLEEWERRQRSNHENIDHTTLAYVLGAISYDSNDFRRTTDNLSFTSLKEVRRVWKEIDRNNNANLATKPSEALQDLNYLVNNPQGLAELVWGWAKNSFCNNYVEVDCKKDDKTWKGNTGDGWNFRERGIYRIVGRGQYDEANEWLKADDPYFSIDLLDKPYALTNPTVSARVAFLHFLRSRIGGKTLTEVLKGDPANFKAARHNQIDMIDPTDPTDPINVNDRSQMFLSCIAQASSPPPN